MYSFSYLEPVCCSISSSNCCFLTFIQISQEAGGVVWYSHLFKNFPQFVATYTVKGFGVVLFYITASLTICESKSGSFLTIMDCRESFQIVTVI